MGVRNASASTTTRITSLIGTTIDTLLMTTGGIGLVQDNAQVIIMWYLQILWGTAANTVLVSVHRGAALTSTVINVGVPSTVVAGQTNFIHGSYTDNPGVVSGLQYSISVQQGAATGNGTFIDGHLAAMVL